MNPEPQTNPNSPFRNPFLYSSLLILLVALYVGYVLLSRHESLRLLEKRAAEQQAEQRREGDRQAIDQLGGSDLAIRALYLSPPTVQPGDTAQLCYDVSNAKTVTLNPPAAEVWPSHSRCINLQVWKTTTFALTVADAAGKTLSQSVQLRVR